MDNNQQETNKQTNKQTIQHFETKPTHEIGNDTQSTNTHSTESSSNGDISVEDLDVGRLTVATNNHLLLAELLGNILGRRARYFNPGLGEESTRDQDEAEIEDGMKWVIQDIGKAVGRGDIVGQATNRHRLSGAFNFLPTAEQVDQEEATKSLVQKLREEIQVGDQGSLQNDGDVRGVEQLDGVGALLTTVFGVFDWEINTESLER